MSSHGKDGNILYIAIPLMSAIVIILMIMGNSLHQHHESVQKTNELCTQEIRNYYEEVSEELGLTDADDDHEKLILRVERCEKVLFGNKK